NAISFIEPEILSLPTATLTDYMDNICGLHNYRHYLADLLRQAPHILPAREEELLAHSQLATGAAENIFRTLTGADLKFPSVQDHSGNSHCVSEGQYLLNMTSQDRTLRANTFSSLLGTYHQYRNTLAASLAGNCRAANFYATTHKYEDTLAASLAGDNIPAAVYAGIISTVHEHLTPLHEYITLKKEVLATTSLQPYDLYVPLVQTGAESFANTYEEACLAVQTALEPLGSADGDVLKQALSSGWIDIYENKGKRSGAYSWGIYGVHPYVLLNYQPRYNSISTLAHELGHALHSYFSNQKQTFINADYTIFCAEVASTTNENLLLEYMLQKATKSQKLYLLNQFLETVRTTLYRQVQFAEFEQLIHAEITAGKTLTAAYLENLWLELNRTYYGEKLTLDPLLASEWSRIPHFYTPFYVYKYATGYSAATAFAAAILANKPRAVEKYLDFLAAGGSDYSLSLLQTAGVDLTTAAPITVTLQKFAAKLAEFKTLLAE
ncbi:MAG: oligoendopeptidase F, partial [Acidaminococcaceae bacterium]